MLEGRVMYYRGWYWFAGHDPASLNRQCGARTPSFFFVREKERRGRKKKPWGTVRRGEAHSLPRSNPCVAAGAPPIPALAVFRHGSPDNLGGDEIQRCTAGERFAPIR